MFMVLPRPEYFKVFTEFVFQSDSNDGFKDQKREIEAIEIVKLVPQ